MTKLFPQFTLFFLGFGAVAMPLIFVLYDSFSETSPTLRMLVIAKFQILAILLFAVQDTRNRMVSFIRSRIWVFVAILVVIALSKVAFDVGNTRLTIDRTVMWLLHVFFGIGAIATLRKLSAHQILMFIACTIGISILMYAVIVLAIELRNTEVNISTCSVSLPGFGNVRYTGYFASFAYMFFLSIAAQKNLSGSLRFFCLLSAVILLFYVIYTGSRGAIAASAVAVMIGTVLLGRQWYRLIIAATVTAILAIFAIGIFKPHACPAYNAIARTAAILNMADANFSPGRTAGTRVFADASISSGRTTASQVVTDATSSPDRRAATQIKAIANVSPGRTTAWVTSYALFKERPFFGQGEINLWQVTDLWVTQAHNSVLQSLMTWGVVGAACFWGLILNLAWNIFRVTRAAPLTYLPYTSAITCMLAYSMIDATLYYSYPLLLSTFAIVGIFATATTLSSDTSDGTRLKL